MVTIDNLEMPFTKIAEEFLPDLRCLMTPV